MIPLTGQLDLDPISFSALSSDPLAPLVVLLFAFSRLLLITRNQSLVLVARLLFVLLYPALFCLSVFSHRVELFVSVV